LRSTPVGKLTALAPGPNWVWLKALNASKRSSRLVVSLSLVFLARTASKLLTPFLSRNWLKPEVPRRSSVKAVEEPKRRKASALKARLLLARGLTCVNAAPRSAKLMHAPPQPVVSNGLLTLKGVPD
jgi:hypothetical protein